MENQATLHESDLDSATPGRTHEPVSIAEVLRRWPDLTPEQQRAADERRLESERNQREREHNDRTRCFYESIGRAYRGCTLNGFQTPTEGRRTVVSALREYVAGWSASCSPNLILFGPVGTGKDHLAIATAREIVEAHEVSVVWFNGGDVFGNIRDRMDSGDNESGLISRLAAPTIAIISDPMPVVGELGSHMATMLLRIVDARYRNGKATWVTLNVANDAEADKRIGPQTWDRLCHDAWKIKCEWTSFRKPARTINC